MKENLNKNIFEKAKSPEPNELSDLLSVCELLEHEKDISKFKELISVFLEKIDKLSDSGLSENVEKAYKDMQIKNLLLRVENISKVIGSIKDNKPYTVGDTEDHYANAVVPDQDGVAIAFSEARAPGPVKLLIGFDVRSAIAFEQEALHVFPIKDQEDLRNIELRKKVCRHVEGNIDPHYIKYIILRIPRKIFPETRLNSNETKSDSMYIFRSLSLNSIQ